MLSQDFIDSMFYCFSTVLFHYLLFTTLPFAVILFYHDPSRLHLGNPTLHAEQGFYYFTLYYVAFSVLYHSTTFHYLLFYFLRPYYVLLYYSTMIPAVCISERLADPIREGWDLLGLLFYG